MSQESAYNTLHTIVVSSSKLVDLVSNIICNTRSTYTPRVVLQQPGLYTRHHHSNMYIILLHEEFTHVNWARGGKETAWCTAEQL